MGYKAGEIKELLKRVASATGTRLEFAYFPIMYDKIQDAMGRLPFSDEYLYKRIYLAVKDAKDDAEIKLNTGRIETIANFLGYDSYDAFAKEINTTPDPILHNCIGTWCSYVRSASGSAEVIASPVRIYAEKHKVFMTLKTSSTVFTGELRYKGNTLYCLLESGASRNIYFVFKVGFAYQPRVLQGIFSGLDDGGDPVAGREVLIRQEEMEFGKEPTKKMRITTLMRDAQNEELKAIAAYFKDRHANLLKAGKTKMFDINDLYQE